MAEMKMVVGLGNPGRKYEGTRHNIGFRVIDLLAESLQVRRTRRLKFGGIFWQAEFEGKKLILLKPQKYMNRSGGVVAEACRYYQIPLSALLVVTDDMALEPGRIRIRARGSAGGHNGLADIIEELCSRDFARLRLGIGPATAPHVACATSCGARRGGGRAVRRPVESGPARDYVLAEPTPEEWELIEQALQRARQAALCWVGSGVEAAMNKFNG